MVGSTFTQHTTHTTLQTTRTHTTLQHATRARLLLGGEGARWFDMQFVDMNGDGKRDLLVTDNRNDGKGACHREAPSQPAPINPPAHPPAHPCDSHAIVVLVGVHRL